MSESKPMKEVSVEEILSQYNLIVPEIQREYVWGQNQYGVFETFLGDIKEGLQAEEQDTPEVKALRDTINNPAIDELTRNSLIAVLEGLSKPFGTMNIGFLYSYKPGYYIGNDREEDLYLIDGQQRFTTLVLVLFYFALKEGRKSDFVQLFKFDATKEKIAFDYRVRSITHQFLIELIQRCDGVNDLLDIRGKSWFLTNYANDTTIKSIAGENEESGVFLILYNFFKNDNLAYYDYVKTAIKFWHFKAEETSQGEELYITMNSRGQQLADNETIRAKLFDDEKVKNNPLEWSEKWEIWQDFFWKNRNKELIGSTADEGFNEFLRWVQVLKMYENLMEGQQNSDELSNEFERILQWGEGSKLDVQYFSLVDIEETFESIKYLYNDFKDEQESLRKIYPKSFIAELIMQKWIANEGKLLDLIDLFQLLPILYYCKKHFDSGINPKLLYRLIRTLRSLSKDTNIGKSVRKLIVHVLYFTSELKLGMDVTDLLDNKFISTTILNEELKTKLSHLKDFSERDKLEDLFWYAEDIRNNDGEILHLINLSNNQTGNFDFGYFDKIVAGFEELIDNEDEVTLNVIHSNIFRDSTDRIEFYQDWYKRQGFLGMITKRIDFSGLLLNDFLVKHQKEFVKNYATAEEIMNEEYAGKQLFIYYILSNNNILKTKVNWDWAYFNFGKWQKYPGFKSLFSNGIIYQGYKAAFRENEFKILAIHSLKEKSALDKLLTWANE